MRRIGTRGRSFVNIAASSAIASRRFVAENSVRAAAPPRLCVVRPDLVGEWIPKLNDEDVTQISSSSSTEVHWKCRNCGGVWQASVRARVAEQIHCPQCAHSRTQSIALSASSPSSASNHSAESLLNTHPKLAALWDTEKNLNLSPVDVTAHSSRVVWWKDSETNGSSFQRAVAHFVLDSRSPNVSSREEEEAQLALLAEIESLSHSEHMNIPSTLELALGEEALQQELAPHKRDMFALWAAAGEKPSSTSGGLELLYEPSASVADTLRNIREVRLEELVHIVQIKKKKANGDTAGDTSTADEQQRSVLPSFVFDKDWKSFFTLTSDEASQEAYVDLGARGRRVVDKKRQSGEGDEKLVFASAATKRRDRELDLPESPSVADEIIDDAKYIPQHIQSSIRANNARRASSYPYEGSDADASRAQHVRDKQRTFRSNAATRSDDSFGVKQQRRSAALFNDSLQAVQDIAGDDDKVEISDSNAADAVGLSPEEARSLQYRRRKPFVPRRTRRGLVLPDEAEELSNFASQQRAAVVAASVASSNLPRAPRVVARPKSRAIQDDE